MSRLDRVRHRLDADLARLAAEQEVPGASVAVLVDGQVVEATAGVVNARTGVSVTPDSLFMIQSVTKVWTATLVMQLVDDGLVALDAPVRAYLPRFRTADDGASARITVRHLLTHTGGFEGDLWAPTTNGTDALARFVDDLVPGARQDLHPGGMYSYSNSGYGVLGRIVEVVRGLPWADALRRHLAGPLGVDELAFCADEALAFRTAIGHARQRPGAPVEPFRVWAVMPPSNPAAGNQLAMSARGMLALARMHGAGGLAPDGTRLLSTAAVRAMQQPEAEHPAAVGSPGAHGLGWQVPARRGIVEHPGDSIGVAALLRLVPEAGVAVALLVNSRNIGGLVAGLVDPLLGELAGVEPAAPLPTPTVTRIDDPGRYAGRYDSQAADHEVAADGDGRLWLTTSDGAEAVAMVVAAGLDAEPERSELRPIGRDTFVVLDASGAARQAVEFLGADAHGRARFLHTGRAIPRTT